MKKTIFLIMVCLAMCIVGCAKESNNDSTEPSLNSNQFPLALLVGADEHVKYIRENVYYRNDIVENERVILSESDRHPEGETCQDCGKHADYLRKESVDVNVAKLVKEGMNVREVFNLIGNPHLRYYRVYSPDPNMSSARMDFYYYYVISDGNVLEIEYVFDNETGIESAKLETLTAKKFVELYAYNIPVDKNSISIK